jgi:hypothetical protein
MAGFASHYYFVPGSKIATATTRCGEFLVRNFLKSIG